MGNMISGGLFSLLIKAGLQTKPDEEKMALNKSLTISCHNTVESFNSTEKSTESVFYPGTSQNDVLRKGRTSKTIYDACQREVPNESFCDATQMSFSKNFETGNDFFEESGSESEYPEVRSCNISFESEVKENTVHQQENTAKKPSFPSSKCDQIEDESTHFEIRSCDISFPSDEEKFFPQSEDNKRKEIREMEENRHGSKINSIDKSKQEVKELPSNAKQNQLPVISQSMVESMDDESEERSIHSIAKTSHFKNKFKIPFAVCQAKAPLDTSQIPHGDNEELLCDILKNSLSSHFKTVDDVAQGSEEDMKVKSISNQTEPVEKTHITTPRDPAIVCSENENPISLIDAFRSMCQSHERIIALFNTILNSRTDDELCTENGSTPTNVEKKKKRENKERTKMNEESRKIEILATSDIEDSAISQEKHYENKYLNPASAMRTKESFIFEESPHNNHTLFKSSCEEQAQCLNTWPNESATNLSIPKSLNINKLQNQNQEEQSLMVMGEKIGKPGNAFLKNQEAGNVMKGRDKFKNHADYNTETSSLRRKQIVSKKSNNLRKENDSTQSVKSLSSWRQKESGSSDSDDSCSDSESSTISERTSNSVKLRKQEATMQWLDCIDEKCKTSDLQKREKDCVESVSNAGRLGLAPGESSLCLRFDNLKLEIFNKPSFVNIDLTSKRGARNLAETRVKTIGGNSKLELAASANVSNENEHQKTTESVVLKKAELDKLRSSPFIDKRKVVKKSKLRNTQNKPLDKAKMRSTVTHQPKRKHHHNKNTSEKDMTQKEIETNIAHELDLEGILSNNQNAASFQSNKTQCLPPSISMGTHFPERSNSTTVLDDVKLNPNYECENHQLLNNDAIELDSTDSLTITGAPNVLDQENRDLAAVAEMANSIESLVDTLSNFHFSDGREFAARNRNEEFCFQRKNFKMSFQPNSNLDNFKLCYERSFSKSSVEFKSDDTKLFLEIESQDMEVERVEFSADNKKFNRRPRTL